MRLLSLLFALTLLAGCSRSQPTRSPAPLTASDLSAVSFHVLAKNAGESVILLGDLAFDPIGGDVVSGTWTLRSWSGDGVPGLPASGRFSGTLFGGSAILSLPLPDGTNSLGVVLDDRRSDRIAGSITLLPDRSFAGSIEAIRP